MQILGFNLTKMSAEKLMAITSPPTTNIEFMGFEKEKVEFLKDQEAAKIFFKYNLSYEGAKNKEDKIEGNIIFEGNIILSTSKEELKNISKSWKKKELPNDVKMPLFNLILRRCTPKAVQLQDEVSLPFHIPMPRVSNQQNQNQS